MDTDRCAAQSWDVAKHPSALACVRHSVVGDAASSTFAREVTGASAEASRDERGTHPSALWEGTAPSARAVLLR